MSLFNNDIAVSLVDDSFIFRAKSQPATLVLPAYVAMQTSSNKVLACGEEAKAMSGKTADNITVIRALVEGTVGDFNAAVALFRHGLAKLRGNRMVRPRVVIAVPTGETVKYVVKQMAVAGGAREVYLLLIGMATAIGMQLEVQKPELRAVLSVSDDSFDFTVVSLASILAGASGGIGTKSFVEDARNYFVLSRQFKPDSQSLESQLMSGGVNATFTTALQGWEVWSGKSEQGKAMEQAVSRAEITTGIMPSLVRMTERIKNSILTLTREQQYQLAQTTIHATGTAMAIPGLAQAISNQLGLPVAPFSAAVHPSIDGSLRALGELKFLQQIRGQFRRR